MNKYRVAILDDMLPPYRIPLYNYINSSDDNIDLDVLLSSLKQKDRSWSIDCKRIKFNYFIFSGCNLNIKSRLIRTGFFNLHFNWGIIRRLLKVKYDIVIISGYSSFTHQLGIIFCHFLKIPVVLWYRSFNESKSIYRKILNIYIYNLIKLSNYYLVPGEKSKNYLTALNISSDLISIVSNPINNKQYLSHYNPKRIKVNSVNIVNILFVGRFIECKGIWELVRAFRNLTLILGKENIKLHLVGDGELYLDIYKMINKEKLYNVQMYGFLQNEELYEQYNNADIFILPSYYETWGLVLNEAMNFRLPIIATNTIGAANEIIKNGINGILVDPKNVSHLSDAMLSLINDRSKRLSMGIESEKIIKNNGIDRSGKIFINTINNMIK